MESIKWAKWRIVWLIACQSQCSARMNVSLLFCVWILSRQQDTVTVFSQHLLVNIYIYIYRITDTKRIEVHSHHKFPAVDFINLFEDSSFFVRRSAWWIELRYVCVVVVQLFFFLYFSTRGRRERADEIKSNGHSSVLWTRIIFDSWILY